MSESKIIKDPVHGYITVEKEFVSLLDSPEFQRLRNIEQGSFRVLYPAARHDRFIHSLGVYHLSCLASKKFSDNIKEDLQKFVNTIKDIDLYLKDISLSFRYASLMHDIGHAPFSHTTEDFFKECKTEEGLSLIEVDLKNACKSDATFEDDFKCANPKAHEILSSILAIYLGKKYVPNINIDYPFVARMITGCLYDCNCASENKKNQIKNCFITLLNSSAVDVDKLDYIKRDTFMSGFSNVVVDTERMINSLTAVLVKENNVDSLKPAFRKNSISVIDNIFRAKNEQSNWVISHPSVQYESIMVQFCIRELFKDTNVRKEVFSKDSLSLNGKKVENDFYRLLNDSDFITKFSKNITINPPNIFNEFFDRSCRRKPLWKSYYEFKFYFGDIAEDVYDFFSPLIEALNTLPLSQKAFFVEDDTYQKLEANDSGREVLDACQFLKDFAETHTRKIEFSFVIIDVENKFSVEMHPEKIYIKFENKCVDVPYKTYADLLGKGTPETDDAVSKNFFYLYVRYREQDNSNICDEIKINFVKRLKELLGTSCVNFEGKE